MDPVVDIVPVVVLVSGSVVVETTVDEAGVVVGGADVDFSVVKVDLGTVVVVCVDSVVELLGSSVVD